MVDPAAKRASGNLDVIVEDLNTRYGALEAAELVKALARDNRFKGRIAAKTSAGIDSALVLDAVAQAGGELPVLFVDTGKLHTETIQYMDTLKNHMGLRNVHTLRPDPEDIKNTELTTQMTYPGQEPWVVLPKLCCAARKAFPMDKAIVDGNYLLVISGQKAAGRSGVKLFEAAGNHIIVNPFAKFDQARTKAALEHIGAPEHPLKETGFTSVGCETCTLAGSDRLKTRWAAHNNWREQQLRDVDWKGFFARDEWAQLRNDERWRSLEADPQYGIFDNELWTSLFEEGQGAGQFETGHWIAFFQKDQWQSLFRDERYTDLFSNETYRNLLMDEMWQTRLFPLQVCGINANERSGPPEGYNFTI